MLLTTLFQEKIGLTCPPCPPPQPTALHSVACMIQVLLCYHLKDIRYAKTLLGSSFSIEEVWIRTAVHKSSSHGLKEVGNVLH